MSILHYITSENIYYLIIIAGLVAGYAYRHRQSVSDTKRLKKTIYQEEGGLNIVTCSTCKEHRDEVFNAIRKGEKQTEMLTKKIDAMNENVLKILFFLKIDKK